MRLLIVGLGRQGQRHFRIASGMQGIEVVATVDPLHDGLGVPHYRDLESALEATHGVQAAIIATPTVGHVDAGTRLLERKIACLVEKPIADSAESARRLIDLAAAESTLLAVGHVERFNPAVQLVAAMLTKGALGTPIAFAFRRVGLPPPGPLGVDVIHDLAVHDIDIFGMLAGAPPSLSSVAGWPSTGVVESAHLLLDASGVNGFVQVNWRTPVRLRDFSITTDECYVEVNYTTQRVDVVQPSAAPDFVDFGEFQSHYGTARRIHHECRQAEPLAEELRAFLDAVSGSGVGSLALGADGLLALEVADAASRTLGQRSSPRRTA